MSSCSSSSTSSSASTFYLSAGKQLYASSKPSTTEASQSQLSTQDDRLKSRDSSSKPVPTLTISTFDSAANQDNGSLKNLKERCDSESSTNSVKPKRLKKNEAASLDNGQRETCQFYQKTGFCRYGRKCRFDHSVSVRPKSGRRSYVNPLSNDENFANICHEPDYADLNVDSLVKQDDRPNTKSSSICRFYFRNGQCHYGSNCRYVHSDPQSIDTEGTSNKTPLKEVTDKTDFKRNTVIETTDVEIDKRTKQKSRISRSTEKNASKSDIETEVSKRSEDTKTNRICHFFFKNGPCHYGSNCRYVHSVPQAFEQLSIDTENPSNETPFGEEINKYFKTNPEPMKRKTKTCKYFARFGTCKFEECKFIHQSPAKQLKQKMVAEIHLNEEPLKNLDNSNAVSKDTKGDSQFNKAGEDQGGFVCKRPVLLRNKKASDMTAEDLLKLRDTEIHQMEKRFPKLVASSKTHFQVEFFPTDPDWRFDVKSVNLLVVIPETYPKDILQLEIMNFQGNLPEKFMRYFNKTTMTWVQIQHEKSQDNDKIELIFRPFLRWLDQSLEDIFISGLKMVKREMEAQAAGIEFVPHEKLSQNIQDKTENKNEHKDNSVLHEKDQFEIETPITPEYEESMPAFLENSNHSAMLVDQTVDNRTLQETAKRGTEIKLRNLELTEGAAGLTCRKLSVTVQCGRCKNRSDVAAAPHRNHRVVCERCHHQQRLSFRPQMLHQYSAIAGYLDLENCQVLDVPLLTCEFSLQCLPCGRQNLLTNVQFGQHQSTWCMFCNSKMVVFVESIKLNQLQPSNIIVESLGQLLKIEKKEKRVKDPAIQEGKPLPENGICKHYKKSFRWLRFPCCGKAYPCDYCHDEKETDHDMKYATRMICGFCGKEQPYANDRPCVLCASNMTKKSGAHWEGGKGCRDKIKMSKDDKQKYAGSGKTVSRKATPAPKKK